MRVLDKSLQSYSLFPDEACELLDKFENAIQKESLKEMGISQKSFYEDYELKGVVPEGGVNKQYFICGVQIKNYISGHNRARSACRKLKDVIQSEIARRFPAEKQEIWRSLGLLFNAKHWPDKENPTDDEIDDIMDKVPSNTDPQD